MRVVSLSCFNSLQTGKCISSKVSVKPSEREMVVSIPFKRESVSQVHGNDNVKDAVSIEKVSIPFKRESVSQGFSVTPLIIPIWRSSFNSLQTGKCISSIIRVIFSQFHNWFQFPSNGKVYLKHIIFEGDL